MGTVVTDWHTHKLKLPGTERCVTQEKPSSSVISHTSREAHRTIQTAPLLKTIQTAPLLGQRERRHSCSRACPAQLLPPHCSGFATCNSRSAAVGSSRKTAGLGIDRGHSRDCDAKQQRRQRQKRRKRQRQRRRQQGQRQRRQRRRRQQVASAGGGQANSVSAGAAGWTVHAVQSGCS